MGLLATDNGGSDFTPAPAGTHIARCCQVIDLGTQTSNYYKDKAGQPKEQHKVRIAWELSMECDEEGQPFLVFKRYTLSLTDKANLRRDLEAWRGRKFTEQELAGFHLKNVLGAPCMLSVVHETRDGDTYANVNAVMAMSKGTVCPPAKNPTVLFDVDDWDDLLFEKFSESLKKTIHSCKEAQVGAKKPEMATAGGGPARGGDLDDSDIPFNHGWNPCLI